MPFTKNEPARSLTVTGGLGRAYLTIWYDGD
jgi:hypothetical protein